MKRDWFETFYTVAECLVITTAFVLFLLPIWILVEIEDFFRNFPHGKQ